MRNTSGQTENQLIKLSRALREMDIHVKNTKKLVDSLIEKKESDSRKNNRFDTHKSQIALRKRIDSNKGLFFAHCPLSLISFSNFSIKYYETLPEEQFSVMVKNYAVCKYYADSFSTRKSGNLVMNGGTGLGKTHLSLAIANVLLQKGFSIMYDSASCFIHTLEKELYGKCSNTESTLQALHECDLLIIDDFGAEYDSQFSRSMITEILSERLSSCKPVIIISNMSQNEMQTHYNSCIVSRLLKEAKLLPFYGTDIRIQKMSR